MRILKLSVAAALGAAALAGAVLAAVGSPTTSAPTTPIAEAPRLARAARGPAGRLVESSTRRSSPTKTAPPTACTTCRA